MKRIFLWLLPAVVVVCAYSLPSPLVDHEPEGGIVSGRVTLGKSAKGDFLEITKDDAICGRIKASPSLVLGNGQGIKNAVILIEGVAGGKEWEAGEVVLDQKDCEYVPHTMVVPAGTQLAIVNSDPILHNVHAYRMGKERKSLFNIAQPIKGQRTSIRQTRLEDPGVVLATCDAGHPWMIAYIVVADNPYYAISDEEGRFQIKDIPPGSYRLKLWHEGIKIAKKEYERGAVKKYYFEEPYEMEKAVIVRPGSHSRVDFEIKIRGG